MALDDIRWKLGDDSLACLNCGHDGGCVWLGLYAENCCNLFESLCLSNALQYAIPFLLQALHQMWFNTAICLSCQQLCFCMYFTTRQYITCIFA